MRTARRRRHAGQGLVEFALILPVFLLIIFGVVDFGRAIFQYNTVAESSRQADRLAVVDQTIADIKTKAIENAIGIALDPDPNGVKVCFKASTMVTQAELTCSNTTASTLCNGGVAPKLIGCLAVVETQSTFKALTPVISNIVGTIPITSRSVNPIEYVCDVPTNAACP